MRYRRILAATATAGLAATFAVQSAAPASAQSVPRGVSYWLPANPHALSGLALWRTKKATYIISNGVECQRTRTYPWLKKHQYVTMGINHGGFWSVGSATLVRRGKSLSYTSDASGVLFSSTYRRVSLKAINKANPYTPGGWRTLVKNCTTITWVPWNFDN